MIKNYIKTAWRALLKGKMYSVINITGLAVGLTAVLLIALWVQNQFLYDNFYSDKENIYKIMNKVDRNGDINIHGNTSAPTAPTLKQQYAEVEYAARVYWTSDNLFSYGERNLKSKGKEVDADFISVFDFALLQGNKKHLLNDPNSIVLTESLAKKLFGDENPLDKTVVMNNEKSYKVTGVLQDLPSYTDFDFTYLVPFSQDRINDVGANWNTNSYFTFVRLKDGADVAAFNKKIEPLIRTNAPDLKWTSVFLYPMSKIHLYSDFEQGVAVGGFIEQVRLIGSIGLLVLLIACINFVNLATARSQKRFKEIGVRKVVGATKLNLIQQFLIESILLACIAGVMAIVLTVFSLPLLNSILDKPILVDWKNWMGWLSLVSFIFFIGGAAGIYPAFVLSAWKPIKSLKGMSAKVGQVFNLRQLLVVLQFGIAIFLIAATLVIHRQIEFAGQRENGYASSQLIEIPAEGDMEKNYDVFKTELIRNNLASNVTRTGWGITYGSSANAGGNFSWEGATPQQIEESFFTILFTQSDFVKTLDLTMVDGRDIDYARLPADSASVLLNETSVKRMKLQDPVGKYLKWGETTYTIVGVVKDFITESPFQDIRPLLVLARKKYLYNIIVRTNPQLPMDKSLKGIEELVKQFNPKYPFTYNFVDQLYAYKFKEQQQIGRLAMVFSLLAISISCLGLFGLAAFIVQTRIKEIGIRKVLGASQINISALLSKDFVKPVLVALLISSPLVWWAMSKWLADFSYRIEIQWWMLAFAGGIALLIALITISSQTIRAANANPVDSLRDE